MDTNLELTDSEDDFIFEVYSEKNSDSLSDYQSSSDESDCIGHKKRKTAPLPLSSSSSSISSTEVSHDDEWVDISNTDEPPNEIKFDIGSQNFGPNVSSTVKKPIDFFKLFFTEDLINEIIKETNSYAKAKLQTKVLSAKSIWHSWRDVQKDEFWAFIGVILNMGTMPVANMQEYWSTKHNSRIPFYADIFTRDRFNQIFWMLHLKTQEPGPSNLRTRLQKVNNFLEYINGKFSEYFIPNKNISVDESIIKFKGRIQFITYNPNKPTKWGIRIFVLTDSETSYVYNILPYYGSITSESLTSPELPVSSRIPIHLYKKILEKIPNAQGYHMFTDRYYTSLPLAEELLKLKCHLTGTIKINRKGIPNSIKKPKFLNKKVLAMRRRRTTLLAWKDKRVITMLSTAANAAMSSSSTIGRGGVQLVIEKPEVVLNYIKSMGGVDRADQYASTYCFLRKSLKWWRKLFFWGMEICTINAYIIYKTIVKKNNQKPLSHLRFVKTLVDQLVGEFRQTRSRTSTSSTEVRLDGKLHVLRKGTKRDCVVCSRRDKKGQRHETYEFCDTCPGQPRMHLGDCFFRYHTLKDYKI